MESSTLDALLARLDHLQIELPSWGFADTGTRFGKFLQDGAAIDIDDKLRDAAEVHRHTGCCPTVAVHVLWDFRDDDPPTEVARRAASYGVRLGSINPNLFQDQEYKWGSFGAPDPAVQQQARRHVLDCVEIARAVESPYISLWFADGTNYPGQDDIRARKRRFTENLQAVHGAMDPGQVLLVEYKPFEPAFYATDIADWGMALLLARAAGPQAKVLVDTGHHYVTQNIEQIVAWLLDEDMLGGFHFNDRRYADDDLTLGSIDPYQVFRIFAEIHGYAHDHGGVYPEIAYMVDQSHNLKPKIEAMIQTVTTAQELYAKAALIDFAQLRELQAQTALVDAEQLLKRAFHTDVTPALQAWREKHRCPADPLAAFRASGYAEAEAQRRAALRKERGMTGTASYA